MSIIYILYIKLTYTFLELEFVGKFVNELAVDKKNKLFVNTNLFALKKAPVDEPVLFNATKNCLSSKLFEAENLFF